MILRRNRKKRNRPGNVIVLVALLLTVLLGMAGYAIDGGMILTQKRKCQATADAAAMAAACVFYQNYQSMNASNLANFRNAARTAAQQVADTNGFHDDAGTSGTAVGTSRITVNFPPNISNSSIYNNSTASKSYDMNLDDGVVEVIVEYYQASYFTKIWGYNSIHLSQRAVARGNFVSPKMGILILDYTLGASLKEAGGGNDGGITVTGGNFVIDSNAANAVVVTGGGVITAPEFDITGGTSASSSQLVTSPDPNLVITGLHPTPDPFKYLQPYAAQTFAALPTRDAGQVTGDGSVGNPYIFEAGYTYTSIPNFSGNSTFVKFTGSGMLGFDLGSNKNFNATACTISGQDVCVYMNSGQWTCEGTGCIMCGSFNNSGNPSGSFTGLTSTPLKGFSYFQPPTNTQDIMITGNGGFSLKGTVYAPNAMIDAGGNADIANMGTQLASRMMKGHGNGNITIAYDGPDAAKTRVLALIE